MQYQWVCLTLRSLSTRTQNYQWTCLSSKGRWQVKEDQWLRVYADKIVLSSLIWLFKILMAAKILERMGGWEVVSGFRVRKTINIEKQFLCKPFDRKLHLKGKFMVIFFSFVDNGCWRRYCRRAQMIPPIYQFQLCVHFLVRLIDVYKEKK